MRFAAIAIVLLVILTPPRATLGAIVVDVLAGLAVLYFFRIRKKK